MILLTSAFAADLVLYDGLTAEQATRRVAADARLADADLRATTLTTVGLGQGPSLHGRGEITSCPGAADPMPPRAAAVSIRDRILAGDTDAARRDADAALSRLACAREVVSTEDVARLWFLKGVAMTDLGDPTAEAAFRQARSTLPSLRWDHATFGDDGREGFDRATLSPPVRLVVLPTPTSPVFLDGIPFPTGPDGAEVSPGVHLVQIASSPVTTLQVRVDGAATLVLASAIEDGALRWVTEDGRVAALTAIVDAVAPGAAFVALPEGTWRRTSAGWSRIASHSVAASPEERRSRLGKTVGWTGVAVTTIGVAAGVTGWGIADGAARWGETADRSGPEDEASALAKARFRDGSGLMVSGFALAGVGAVAAALGLGAGGVQVVPVTNGMGVVWRR